MRGHMWLNKVASVLGPLGLLRRMIGFRGGSPDPKLMVWPQKIRLAFQCLGVEMCFLCVFVTVSVAFFCCQLLCIPDLRGGI